MQTYLYENLRIHWKKDQITKVDLKKKNPNSSKENTNEVLNTQKPEVEEVNKLEVKNDDNYNESEFEEEIIEEEEVPIVENKPREDPREKHKKIVKAQAYIKGFLTRK